MMGNSIRIVGADSTSFFKRRGEALDQQVDVLLENTGEPRRVTLTARVGAAQRVAVIDRLLPGTNRCPVDVPEISSEVEAVFTVEGAGGTAARHAAKLAPRKRWEVVFVPIAHHDYGYTDPIEELLPRYDGFYDSVLEFLDETSDWPEEARYRYTVESSWSLVHYLANRDEKVGRALMKNAKSGRFEVSALFANMVDAFCSHEELARSLYPSFRIRHRYGIPITTASIVDIPGLSWSLPQVLARAGIRYLFTGFPTYFEWENLPVKHSFWDEQRILRQAKPDAFLWSGPDESSVLAYYQRGYGFITGTGAELTRAPNSYEELLHLLPANLDDMERHATPFNVMRYVYRGEDNHPPSMDICHYARRWNAEYAYPKVIVGTNAMFFEKLERQCTGIRTVRGELPHTDYPLALTSAAKETARSRLAHGEVLTAESLATVNHVLAGTAHQRGALDGIYDDLLLFDEHCFGMAYPIGKIHDWNWSSKSHHLYRASAQSQRITMRGLVALAAQVHVEREGLHITVFNPLAFARSDYVTLSILDFTDIWVLRSLAASGDVVRKIREHAFVLIDEATGRRVPCQSATIDDPRLPVPYADSRYSEAKNIDFFDLNLSFYIEDLPPMGWKTLRLDFKDTDGAKGQPTPAPRHEGRVLENRFYRIEIDPDSGTVARILDKVDGLELVDAGCVHGFNQVVTRLVERNVVEPARFRELLPGVSGEVYSSVCLGSTLTGCPNIMQEIRLYHWTKRIDLATRILKDATPFQEVYVAFPFAVENPRFQYEGPTSEIRPFADQLEGTNTHHYTVQSWARVCNESKDIVLAPVEAHTVEFGGLWPCAVSQAHHCLTPAGFLDPYMNPANIDKGHLYSFLLNSNYRTNFHPTQVADMIFSYSLTSGRPGGDHPSRLGWQRRSPPVGIFHQKSPGESRLPGSLGFCTVEPDNVRLVTLKIAERGDALILRLLELKGEPTQATVTLPHCRIAAAYHTSIVEEAAMPVPCSPSQVTIDLEPRALRTIRIDLAQRDVRHDGANLSFH